MVWAGQVGRGGQHPTDPGGWRDTHLPHGIRPTGTLEQLNEEQV